jgi:hypothetical protein
MAKTTDKQDFLVAWLAGADGEAGLVEAAIVAAEKRGLMVCRSCLGELTFYAFIEARRSECPHCGGDVEPNRHRSPDRFETGPDGWPRRVVRR